MKQTFFILTFFVLFCSKIIAQNFTEYHFKFKIKNRSELDTITQIISIDNVKDFVVYAYANDKELDEFQKLGYKIDFLQRETPKSLTMATTVAEMSSWNRYPTYEVYRQMMKNFEFNYPSLCKLDSIGTTVNGRQLYVLKISDNVSTKENEPEFFYTSTMHGDETTGFILMLRLVDSLLSSYGTSAKITNLVNNIEIYINPDANPDGTYYGGNSTVSGARRYNANGKDLNRDFPDPRAGANTPYQPETQAMMDFAEEHHFVMSANFHGGSEVMNYPWDTWSTSENLHADTDWFEQVCTDYVTTARTGNTNYMTDVTSDGVTHGATWYKIDGGRQDYMNYWHQCREVTIELSESKLLATESLNTYWNYNKESLLNYINECLYGIRGVVKNQNQEPLNAMIWVIGHDQENDSSMVFTDPGIGDYHRLIQPGSYDIVASAYGYYPDTAKNVLVEANSSTEINFELKDDERKHSLSGYILDKIDGSPLENVNIKITNAAIPTVLSSNNGSYLFNGVVEDTINLLIQKKGFVPIDTDIVFTDNDTIFNFKLYPDKVEDFEKGDFKKFDWNFTGNVNWIISDKPYEGNYCSKSGNVGDSQSTIMYFNETITQNGYISFYKKVSSESGYDFLKFYIDGVEKDKWSGSSDWSFVKYKITAGLHTFKWEYIKDNNTSSGSDCAWVDYISLPADNYNLISSPLNLYDTLNINETSNLKIFIENTGNVNSEYNVNYTEDWISSNKLNNTLSYKQIDTVLVTINTTNLVPGYYNAQFLISKQNQETDTVHINVMVRDTISSNLTPTHITDTLWGGQNANYSIIVNNNGVVSLDYNLSIENAAENSWINLNKYSGSLLLSEYDTINIDINTEGFGFGDLNCYIIFTEQDQDSDTIPVSVFVKDTTESTLNPTYITDTLKHNSIGEYPIIVSNKGFVTFDYNIEIENSSENTWISLSRSSGNLSLSNPDTIIVTVNTTNLNFGNINCNIIYTEQDNDTDTIPVSIYVKDTIIAVVSPTQITDTLDQSRTKEYPIIIQNTGNRTLDYSADFNFSTNTESWASLDKYNGTVLPENIDTIIMIINTNDISQGDYYCSLIVNENDGDSHLIPVNLYVNQTQSVEKNHEITKFELFPNPFKNQLNIILNVSPDYNYVKIKLFNICGNLVSENIVNTTNFNELEMSLKNIIDIQHLTSGIYFIQISTSSYQITKRIIKD